MVVVCAGSPVLVDMPQNNLSDPEAPESPFFLPPDPFGNQITDDRSSGHELTGNPEGSHLTRGGLFNAPTGRSTPSVHENDAGDPSPHHAGDNSPVDLNTDLLSFNRYLRLTVTLSIPVFPLPGS